MHRVVYVDLDAHHGDGVEAILGGDERVTFISLHEEGRWPGTGRIEDRRGGRACNCMVPRGLNDTELQVLLDGVVLPAIRAQRPEAMVLVLGADALAGDPLSAMDLSNVALWQAAEACLASVERAVVVGGGGYNPWTAARFWAGFWGRLRGAPLPDLLPAKARAILANLECDLVDSEDVDPAWLTTLADPPRPGRVRARIPEIVALLGTAMT